MRWLLAAVATTAVAILWWSSAATAPVRGGMAAAATPAAGAAAAAPAAVRAPVTASTPPAAPRPCTTFDGFLARFVTLGAELERVVRGGDHDRAREIQRHGDALWTELHRCVHAPDAKALVAYSTGACSTGFDSTGADSTGAANDAGTAATIRRRLIVRLLRTGLAARHARASAGSSRAPLDELVTGIVGALASGAGAARDLGPLLVDQPYLGVAHEESVLDLLTLTVEHPFLHPLAADLLCTLWHNLEALGARTSEELAGLALLFKSDANPGRRVAALRHLLTARDGRYRDLVVDDVLRDRDGELARAVAMAAALALAPRDALDVVERLIPVGGEALMPALLVLGERDSQLLRVAYDHQLAAGTAPELRAELVTGAGFAGSADGVEVARTAFAHDPDPRVRSRALYVLTGPAGAAIGEPALHQALDDPELGTDARALGEIALALRNLRDPNAVQRVSQRLLARPGLRSGDRAQLEKWLRGARPGR